MENINTLSRSVISDNQIMSDLDKMIRIKHHKQKNKNKTCIYGILDFVPENDIDTFIKSIKKKLGCSGIITDEITTSTKGKKISTEVVKVLVFSGNHVEEIKEFLLEQKIVDKDHIKI